MKLPDVKRAAVRVAPEAARETALGEEKHSTEPEFGKSRRRFLVAMFMCGAVSPERVVERILIDIRDDSAFQLKSRGDTK